MRPNKKKFPGASDKLPKETQQALKTKPSVVKVWQNVPPPSEEYTPLDFPELPGKSLLEDLKTPPQYFSTFVTEEMLTQWADWTNVNATKKYAEFNKDQT